MGKRPSFIEAATDRMRFLVDDQGFAGPEQPRSTVPGIVDLCYHRSDVVIEVSHVVGFMGEDYVETRCLTKGEHGQGEWVTLGNNTTHTGYQLRRALDLQARAIWAHLGLKQRGP